MLFHSNSVKSPLFQRGMSYWGWKTSALQLRIGTAKSTNWGGLGKKAVQESSFCLQIYGGTEESQSMRSQEQQDGRQCLQREGISS